MESSYTHPRLLWENKTISYMQLMLWHLRSFLSTQIKIVIVIFIVIVIVIAIIFVTKTHLEANTVLYGKKQAKKEHRCLWQGKIENAELQKFRKWNIPSAIKLFQKYLSQSI